MPKKAHEWGKKMADCFFCKKGAMEPTTTTYMVDLKECIVIIRNVPCEECPLCGEKVFAIKSANFCGFCRKRHEFSAGKLVKQGSALRQNASIASKQKVVKQRIAL